MRKEDRRWLRRVDFRSLTAIDGAGDQAAEGADSGLEFAVGSRICRCNLKI